MEPREGPEVSVVCRQQVAELWTNEISTGIAALDKISTESIPERQTGLSLVETCRGSAEVQYVRLEFVHWLWNQAGTALRLSQAQLEDRPGRVVECRKRLVVYSTEMYHKRQLFREDTIIVSNIGVKMYKDFRVEIPGLIIRLKTMLETAAAQGEEEIRPVSGDDIEPCVLCEQHSGFRPPRGTLLKTCPVCLLDWHSSCCELVTPYATAAGLVRHIVVHPLAFSKVLYSDHLCALCRHVMAQAQSLAPAAAG